MKLATFAKLSSALILTVALAKADPEIEGTISFDGASTTNTGNLIAATSFTSIYDTFVNPGATGDYASVPVFTPVTFTPFSFSAAGVTPLWTFTSGGLTYSFSATSINVDKQTTNFLDLSGVGWANITGYETTEGAWTIDITHTGPVTKHTVFAFGSSEATLPDSGGTALLIGLGLAGIAVGVIAQRRKLTKA